MDKNLEALYSKAEIQQAIDLLDKDKIHILYFSYYFNFHNIYHNPLLLSTKLLNFFNGKASIDHITHICRFVFDEEDANWTAKVFEATMERGMEQNDLFSKLKSFQGICYIETLDKEVDKVKAKAFENKYLGTPYSKELAALSGIDIKLIDKNYKSKSSGGFCSWLETLFLQDQGVEISDDPLELTPTDIFEMDLGEKRILFKS